MDYYINGKKAELPDPNTHKGFSCKVIEFLSDEEPCWKEHIFIKVGTGGDKYWMRQGEYRELIYKAMLSVGQ